jgi:hypothetical protein
MPKKITNIDSKLLAGPIPPSRIKQDKPVEKDFPKTMDIPTVEAGTHIQIIFGRRRITEPKVAWYGHVSVERVELESGGGSKW